MIVFKYNFTQARQAAPWGLFLQDIHYTQQSLESATSDVTKLPLPIPAYCISTCENRIIDDGNNHGDTYNIDEGASGTDNVVETIHCDTSNIDDGAYTTDNIDDNTNADNDIGKHLIENSNDNNNNTLVDDLSDTVYDMVDDTLASETTNTSDKSNISQVEIENSDLNKSDSNSDLANEINVEKDPSIDNIKLDPAFKRSC